MGGNDYCSVYGCSNSRKDPERLVIMPHVGILRWHQPRSEKDIKLWQKVLNRDKFKVKATTKVCSNHFAAGYCSDACSIPSLYLRGYDIPEPKKRKSPTDRSDAIPLLSAKRQKYIDGFDFVEEIVQTPHLLEHDYDSYMDVNNSRTLPYSHCGSCQKKKNHVADLLIEISEKDLLIEKLRKENEKLKGNPAKETFSIESIMCDDKAVNFYTGLQNYLMFEWIFNKVRDKAQRLTYYNGDSSYAGKSHNKKHKKKGRKRKLDLKNELFLTFVRIRLGLVEQDLSYRFNVCQSSVSQILSTWIPFLASELKYLLYWPTREENNGCYPSCFEKFPNVISIIDCTEGAVEKPSLAKAQAQTYSSYKSKNTWKKLLSITPCGTISFISKSYGGCASDRYITETCGILDKLKPGDVLMADKGFNISDLLVGKGSKLVIPPFLKDKGQFTKRNCKNTSNIAKARIHVERAIARIKDFRILQGAVPLSMKDLFDDVFIICAAITNLAPLLVPL